jgi:hypothetical protein
LQFRIPGTVRPGNQSSGDSLLNSHLIQVPAEDGFFYPDVMVSCDPQDHAAVLFIELRSVGQSDRKVDPLPARSPSALPDTSRGVHEDPGTLRRDKCGMVS